MTIRNGASKPHTGLGLVDPRGAPPLRYVSPAPRLTTLSGSRLLLIDNGKLSATYGSQAIIGQALRDGIADAAWDEISLDLLRLTNSEIDPLADEIVSGRGPQVAILALADAGVSMQTALLALALEARGVPAAVIATPLGGRLSRAIFESRGLAVPNIVVDILRTDSAEKICALMDASMVALRAGLTKPIESLQAAAKPLFDNGTDERAWSNAALDMKRFQDWVDTAGIGDGLPLVPPASSLVADMLATVDEDPETVIYEEAVTSARSLRICDAAANAVMAGCPPIVFPIVLAALRAVARLDYRLSQAAITTHPSGNAVVFSGGDPAAFGLESGSGCLGPCHRGNATAGRAVSLAVRHLFGARPGAADLTIFGSPAEFTYCFAETRTESPWPSLASEFGADAPGVFVLKAESPRNLLEHLVPSPEVLIGGFASAAVSIASNNSYVPGDLLVLVNPEHTEVFADAGWNRQDFKMALHEAARISRAALKGHGVSPIRPEFMDDLDELPVTRGPDDVRVVVAGAPGPQSMVALPWGFSRGQWESIK